MALQDKYAELIQTAKTNGTENLQVREQDGVLYIDGQVATGELKDKLWGVYDKIDPNFRSGDLVLNVGVTPAAPAQKYRVTTQSSNLNVRKGPGTDQPIIGKVAHDSQVTLLSRYNAEWALVRTDKGEEGYCATDYLTAE